MNKSNGSGQAMSELDAEQVIEKLEEGWELRNRGTGWWVSEPMKPYKSSASNPVTEAVYNQLESEGLIEARMLARSMVATLKQH